MTLVVAVSLGDGVSYAFHPHHRNDSYRDDPHRKSQWRPDFPQNTELECFFLCFVNEWWVTGIQGKREGWGVYLPPGPFRYVGSSADARRDLLLAKFVDGTGSHSWHGYPADYQARPQDVPDPDVLKEWLRARPISPRAVRLISSGQPCDLSDL